MLTSPHLFCSLLNSVISSKEEVNLMGGQIVSKHEWVATVTNWQVEMRISTFSALHCNYHPCEWGYKCFFSAPLLWRVLHNFCLNFEIILWFFIHCFKISYVVFVVFFNNFLLPTGLFVLKWMVYYDRNIWLWCFSNIWSSGDCGDTDKRNTVLTLFLCVFTTELCFSVPAPCRQSWLICWHL